MIDDVAEEEGGANRLITVRLNPKELGQYEALDQPIVRLARCQ